MGKGLPPLLFTALAALWTGVATGQDSPPTGNFSIQITETESCQYNRATLFGYVVPDAGRSREVMLAGGYIDGDNGHNFSIVQDGNANVSTLIDHNIGFGTTIHSPFDFALPVPCGFTVPNAGDNAAVLYCGPDLLTSTGTYHDASASTTSLRIAGIQSYWLCDFATFFNDHAIQPLSGTVVGLINGDAPTSSNLTSCVPVGLEFSVPGTSGDLLEPSASVDCNQVVKTITASSSFVPSTTYVTALTTTTASTTITASPMTGGAMAARKRDCGAVWVLAGAAAAGVFV